jgi:hypothetical protein
MPSCQPYPALADAGWQVREESWTGGALEETMIPEKIKGCFLRQPFLPRLANVTARPVPKR